MQRFHRRPALWTMAAVAGLYLLFTGLALALHQGNPAWFLWIGTRYADLDATGRIGYDGQFVYYIAAHGLDAVPHLDNPAYRLQRILSPLVVAAVGGLQPDRIPWAMIGVNYAAIVGSTGLLAQWLQRQRVAAIYAAGYGLFVGLFLAYTRDLTEPLAFALAAAGTIAWLRNRPTTGILVLAFAVLAKETVILFVLALAMAALFRRRPARATAVLLALVPWGMWEIWLWMRFDTIAFAAGPALHLLPLAGIFPHLTLEPGRLTAFLFVGIPAIVLAVYAAVRICREPAAEAFWLLLFNALLVATMPIAVYDHVMHAGRNAVGMVLASLFCMPYVAPALRRGLLVCWTVPTAIWLIPVLRWAPWLSKV